MGGASYVVRSATVDDVAFLADVVMAATRAQERVADGFDEQAWRRDFCSWTELQVSGALADRDTSETSVIEIEGERAGRLRVVRREGVIELAGIQLAPHVQGHGIGTAIIESMKMDALTAGAVLELAVEKDNPDARRLYDRLGFVEVGETEDEHQLRWVPSPSTRAAPGSPGR